MTFSVFAKRVRESFHFKLGIADDHVKVKQHPHSGR